MSVAIPNAPTIAPGYRLDRYELLCPVAEGGMASIWVARMRGKHGFEKLVAIKMILPKFAQDTRFERMFLDEAGIASRITHPNVAEILDLGEEHDVLYLALEWVDGDALSKIAQAARRSGAPFLPGVALRILADTCGGLQAAHDLRSKDGQLLNVVHRDVSPQNILVSQTGVAKLIDFGIAKARDRMSEETSSGTLKGKINYMAPEQALGKPVDARADLWAVGATLYYLLAGHPPFEGAHQLETLHMLTSGRPPPPLPPQVHPAIRAIAERAMKNDPRERFQSGADMQAALEAAMAEAKLNATTSDVAAFVRRHAAHRAEKRKQALELALGAAAERARVAQVLDAATTKSSSGSQSNSGVIEASARLGAASPARPDGTDGSGPQSVGSLSGSPLVAEESSRSAASAAWPPVPAASWHRKTAFAVGLVLLGGVVGAMAVGLRDKARPTESSMVVTPAAIATEPRAEDLEPAAPVATTLPSAMVVPPTLPEPTLPATSDVPLPVVAAEQVKLAPPKPVAPRSVVAVPAKHHRVNDGF